MSRSVAMAVRDTMLIPSGGGSAGIECEIIMTVPVDPCGDTRGLLQRYAGRQL